MKRGRFMRWVCQHVAYLSTNEVWGYKGAKPWCLYIHIFPVYCVRIEPWLISCQVGTGWTSTMYWRWKTRHFYKELQEAHDKTKR